jgi:hypothetical protein
MRDDGVENIFEWLLGASLRPDIVILRGLPSETPGSEEPANEKRHRREVQPGWAGKRTRAALRAPQQRREQARRMFAAHLGFTAARSNQRMTTLGWWHLAGPALLRGWGQFCTMYTSDRDGQRDDVRTWACRVLWLRKKDLEGEATPSSAWQRSRMQAARADRQKKRRRHG